MRSLDRLWRTVLIGVGGDVVFKQSIVGIALLVQGV
jgi:hypothetical protein